MIYLVYALVIIVFAALVFIAKTAKKEDIL